SNNSHNKKIKEYSLVIGKVEGVIDTVLFPFKSWENSFSYFNTQHLKSFNNSVFYYPRYSNEIYKLNEDTVQFAYMIDLGSNKIPEENMKHITDQKFR